MMRRWTLNILAGLSLVVCVATLFLWVRSYVVGDALSYGGAWTATEVAFARGRFFYWRWTTDDPAMIPKVLPAGFSYTASAPTSVRAYSLPGGYITTSFHFAGTNGLRHRLATPPVRNEIWYVHIPCWQIVLATALLPAIAIWMWVRRRARNARLRQLGLCPSCEYDLRAHAAGQRCPECGWLMPPDFPRPNARPLEQAKDGRDAPPQI